jgi:hypothetical protein
MLQGIVKIIGGTEIERYLRLQNIDYTTSKAKNRPL